ncbi:MAG TPA: DUF6364 family protein [Bacteroidia bacterium]|jgi:hypothetical protein|nr:DUF6364 family protein [Bacteroidia bacterium]HQF28898.1 DUF6364 family protein [Bacteroidia bacterium]HQK98661.1 DUF6364 family protein [Bacteroidia bacterium]
MHLEKFPNTRMFEFQNIRVLLAKLTLTIDQEVVENAKVYAKKNGRSLSSLIEGYLKALSQQEDEISDLSPKVKSLLGSVKVPADFNYKTALSDSINSKHC